MARVATALDEANPGSAACGSQWLRHRGGEWILDTLRAGRTPAGSSRVTPRGHVGRSCVQVASSAVIGDRAGCCDSP